MIFLIFLVELQIFWLSIFDGDLTNDLTILQSNSVTSSSTNQYVKVESPVGNSVIGSGSGGFYYVSNLINGAIISTSANFISSGSLCYGPGYVGSQFCGVTDGYIGVKFAIGTNTHYGWVKLDVTDSSNFVVKEYAYHDTPDAPLTAGQTVLGIEDNEFSIIKIVALNKSIALFNLPQQTNYRLFSLTGQSVLDGQISNNTHVIEANTLASGIYIIELTDASSKAVIRKKLIL